MLVFFLYFILGEVVVNVAGSIATIEGEGEITQNIIQSLSYRSFTEVIIKHGPGSIGPGSFLECESVNYMYISDTIKNIDFSGGHTFRNMISLNKIEVASTNDFYSSDDQGILYDKQKTVLYRAPNLKTINIPPTVELLYNQCFQANKKITCLLIPNTVKKIMAGFIYDVSNFPDNLTFQAGSTISEFFGYSFAYNNFKLVFVPKSVKILHENAFAHSFISEIQFEKGSVLETISSNCFIENGFTEIIFPENLRSINKESIKSCSVLHTIRIPKSTTFIHPDSFSGCIKLSTIIVDEANPNYTIFEGALFSKDKKSLIIAPTQAPVVKIPPETEIVGSTAIQGCTLASDIELDENNTHLDALDGVLYTKGFGKCIAVVGGREAVEFHEDCEEIGSFAMYNCKKAKSIRMKGDKIKTIQPNSFYGCEGFDAYLDLKNVETIGENAFYSTKGLINITFSGNKIREIYIYAFSSSSIKYIYLSKSITYLGPYLFSGSSLELFDYPSDSSFTSFPEFTCQGAGKLKSIRILSNIESIGKYCFQYCDSLSRIDFLHASNLVSISADAFAGAAISELVLNSNTAVLESSAFSYCKKLTSISFPFNSQIRAIHGSCFCYCISLEYFEVPEKVSTLDPSVFEGCTSLKEIRLSSKNIYFKVEDGILYDNEWKVIVYPCGKAIGVLSSNTADIGSNVFYRQSVLTNLTFNAAILNLKVIKSNTFNKCDKLKEVVFNTLIESIDKNWMTECPSIQRIVFPACSRLSSFSASQFEGVSSLQSVEFGHDSIIKSISARCFAGCISLLRVSIPDSLNEIQEGSFDGCSSLEEINFIVSRKAKNTNPITIGRNSFNGCERLSDFDFRRVRSIGESGFRGSGIRRVNFTINVDLIGDSAFVGCTNLEFISYCGTSEVKGIGFDEGISAHVRFSFAGSFSNCLLVKSIDRGCVYHPPPTIAQVCIPSAGVISAVAIVDSPE